VTEASDTPHGRLLGLPDDELIRLAPEATHQHAKGGLYRSLGPIVNGETKLPMVGEDGLELRAWLHVHPHQTTVYARGVDEDAKYRPIGKVAVAKDAPEE
jgi:hypothetical protein